MKLFGGTMSRGHIIIAPGYTDTWSIVSAMLYPSHHFHHNGSTPQIGTIHQKGPDALNHCPNLRKYRLLPWPPRVSFPASKCCDDSKNHTHFLLSSLLWFLVKSPSLRAGEAELLHSYGQQGHRGSKFLHALLITHFSLKPAGLATWGRTVSAHIQPLG